MGSAHDFLQALAVVLCVAAVTTVVFQRLRQPVVLGYLIAGLIVGPYVPIPLVADVSVVQTLSELGVILLMFSLGLEFSLRKLVQVAPTAGITAVIQSSLMVWLGFVAGRAFGWSVMESIFAGAIIAISSTTIIAKAFDEQGVRGGLRELVVGILIVEDLLGILLMAILTALATQAGDSGAVVWMAAGKLALFLAALIGGGMLVVPRFVRFLVGLRRNETLLVACVGICFAISLLALELGYSVALGAFIAGTLVAESGEQRRIEHLVQPVRDVFGAIFFVSVGMLIDPRMIAAQWVPVAILTGVVLVGKVIGVSLGAFLTGNGPRTSIQAGMSLAQIGEFSFIIAALGLTLKATRPFLYPVAVAVSAITTLTTPWLIRSSGTFASFVDRCLPPPLQTFASLYGTWLERLRASRAQGGMVRRLVGMLAIDAGLLAAVIIGGAVAAQRFGPKLAERMSLDPLVALGAIAVLAGGIAVPFIVGVVRITGRLGRELASAALPNTAGGGPDLASAPRRAMVVTLQLGLGLVVLLPLAALTQPFLPGYLLAPLLGALCVGLGVAFWRGAANLEGHVRAGAQVIVEALAKQSKSGEGSTDPLSQVNELLVGMGDPEPCRIPPSSRAVGKTLAELDLRSLTGATVLAITRDGSGSVLPSAKEVIRAGDVLALAGTQEAVDAARALLSAPGRETLGP
jgi:CPA2 family monovalent cation:H+ antiporter-2